MIKAAKQPLAEMGFGWMIRRMLERHFYAHRVRRKDIVRHLDPAVPSIFYANHSSWWDGFVALHLCRDVFGLDGILMMEEKQLARYSFFRWIGAFGVNRDNQAEAKASLEYAASEIRHGRRILWMYPQGVLLPNDMRPVAFYHGISHLAKSLGEVQLVCVAHRYEFLAEQRPEIFTAVGPCTRIQAGSDFESKELTRTLEDILTGELERLRLDVAEQKLSEFEITLRGALSTHVKYDRFRGIAP